MTVAKQTEKTEKTEIVLENGARIVVLADQKSCCSIMIEPPSTRSRNKPHLRVEITRPAEKAHEAGLSIRTCTICHLREQTCSVTLLFRRSKGKKDRIVSDGMEHTIGPTVQADVQMSCCLTQTRVIYSSVRVSSH